MLFGLNAALGFRHIRWAEFQRFLSLKKSEEITRFRV